MFYIFRFFLLSDRLNVLIDHFKRHSSKLRAHCLLVVPVTSKRLRMQRLQFNVESQKNFNVNCVYLRDYGDVKIGNVVSNTRKCRSIA